jgi:hypothetical protein
MPTTHFILSDISVEGGEADIETKRLHPTSRHIFG